METVECTFNCLELQTENGGISCLRMEHSLYEQVLLHVGPSGISANDCQFTSL